MASTSQGGAMALGGQDVDQMLTTFARFLLFSLFLPFRSFCRFYLSKEVVRVPGVEPGSMASEATTLSIVLHSQGTERVAFPGGGGFQAVLLL